MTCYEKARNTNLQYRARPAHDANLAVGKRFEGGAKSIQSGYACLGRCYALSSDIPGGEWA